MLMETPHLLKYVKYVMAHAEGPEEPLQPPSSGDFLNVWAM